MYKNEIQFSTISIRQLTFIVLIIVIGSLIFWQLKNFIPAFLGAYTLYVLLRKWMLILTKKLKGHSSLAAIILLTISFVIILLPLNGLLSILSSRFFIILKYSNKLWTFIEKLINRFEKHYGFSILTDKNLEQMNTWATNQMEQLIGATFNGAITILMMYFILFFMLTEAKFLERLFFQCLPLKAKNIIYLKNELYNAVISNAIGIPLVAVFQGILALLGFFIAGVNEPFLWFVVTCIVAILPILGSALVYIPLSLMLLSQHAFTEGLFLLFYGFLIVSSADNIFRFWLQNKISSVHPLITVFGVIIGIDLFGFIGLIFGPILISVFVLLNQIYNKEFRQI